VFVDADFAGASFSGATLIGTMFAGVDLENADLEADLREAVFLSSNLSGARFGGGLLLGCQMDDETLGTLPIKKPKDVSRIKGALIRHGYPLVRFAHHQTRFASRAKAK
jgi:hypothetical protein